MAPKNRPLTPALRQSEIGRSDICAVVVTFFPPADVAQNLEAIAPQVATILVVDNASSESSLRPIHPVGAKIGATIACNRENTGLATALNVGLRFAREHGYRWLATFDQDGLASPDMMNKMIALVASYKEPERLALVTPLHVDRRLGLSYANRACLARGDNWRLLPTAMTSGNLVNVAAADSIGGFDGSLFIDYVDNDFCLRLRRKGYHVVEASDAVLWHSLGTTEMHRFLWKKVRTTNHSALRRYYSTRNGVITWRNNWRFDFRWIVGDIKRFFLICAYILLWEKQKNDKLIAIAHGLWDGVRNVRGQRGVRSQRGRSPAEVEPTDP